MKIVLPLVIGCIALSGCETVSRMQGVPGTGGVQQEDGQMIGITGGIIDGNMQTMPIITNDPRVSVYPLDGPVQNPLSVERYTSVVENTTSGGYTVFDESVKVYPLPGSEVPAFVPPHAVPPYAGAAGAGGGRVGAPTSLTHSNLPPVPTMAVGAADPFANPPVDGMMRQPAMLIADEGAQQVRAPQGGSQGVYGQGASLGAGRVSAPVSTTVSAPASSGVSGGGVSSGGASGGRKASPLLTGY